MLKPEEILIEVGRAEKGGVIGDFMRVIHQPTGVSRGKGPPLGKPGLVQRELFKELEAELRQRGLTDYLLPDGKMPTKNKSPKKKR
jgi:hypothetical protein